MTAGLRFGSVSDARPVVVVGSGAAGLAAALAAAGSGADVVVVESSRFVGGTTALSGGLVWLPAHGLDTGSSPHPDTPAEAMRYLCEVVDGDSDPELLEAFVTDAGRVATAIEARTALGWEVLERWPDYHGELPGARAGRSLWPRPVPVSAEVEAMVQPAPDQPSPSSPVEGGPSETGAGRLVLAGHVRGRALVAALLAAALDARVEVRRDAPASRLCVDDGHVTGVDVGGERLEGRVVLATGGFQHDARLRSAFLPGCPVVPMGTTGCAGSGLRMAMQIGAALANMSEGWWMPAVHVPGERLDGAPHHRSLRSEAAQPGAILVDRTGRRFVDEAQNYGDVGRAMQRFGPGRLRYPAAPCWLVFDSAYRRRYAIGPLTPEDPDPRWLTRAEGADGVDGLASRTGLPAPALGETMDRFNAGAEAGEDRDFGRGSLPYDRWIGDDRAPHPTLAPLADPPYYALEVGLGCMGTKGGPRTDAHGRVRSVTGGHVAGLYAAGNAAANPFGTATPAGGATLGPALVFGFRAGEAAARDR